MPAAHKIKPTVFPLSKQAGRVALLAGLTAGTVTDEELQANLLKETEGRPHKKPVVVPWHTGGEQRFESIRDAAKYLLIVETRGSRLPKGIYYTQALQCIEKRIARYCNADNVVGYYWAE